MNWGYHYFQKHPDEGVCHLFFGVVGGVLADNLFFLFNSVLSAATTGLVARAWPKGVKNAREETIGSRSNVGSLA